MIKNITFGRHKIQRPLVDNDPLSVSFTRDVNESGEVKRILVKINRIVKRSVYTRLSADSVRAYKTNILPFLLSFLSLFHRKVEACVDVSEWYYRMFQKNLKLRTNIVVGTVPLQNYETPQKTADVTEDFSLHPRCTTATITEDDTQPLKNSERMERGRSSLSRTYRARYTHTPATACVNYRYLRETTGLHYLSFSRECKYSGRLPLCPA